jgi:hypothetical protein
MSFVHRIVGLVALTALGLAISGAATAAQEPRAPAAAGCDAPLPLVWIDDFRASPRALDEAEREASRIWAPAGITFDWARAQPHRAIRAGEVLVMVRERLAGLPRADLQVRRRQTLGRVIRVSADRPSPLIELAMPAVTASVLRTTLFGRPIAELPESVREATIGRGLGRVLAHEIGHWLFGREHAPDGLMRAAITRRELVDPIAPPLPAAWPSLARGQLLARRACALPCPVRQPVTEEGTVSCH